MLRNMLPCARQKSSGMPRLLVWNINALAPTVPNFVLKHGSLKGFFEEHQADIVCFQETKLIEEKLTRELACVDGYESFWAFSQTKKGYSGVATYVRTQWSPVAAEIDALGTLDAGLNGEGRAVLTDHGSFVLVNVYVPNAGKRGAELSERADLKVRFLHALKARCDSLLADGRQVVIVGDLNVAASAKDVHSKLDWGALYHPEELEAMRALLRDYTDVWRLQHPDTTGCFTVFDEKTSARAFNQGVRIDYVLVSPGLLPGLGACEILQTPPKWSDHLALTAELGPLQPPPPHEPLPQSSLRMKRFDDRSQRSISALFARRAAGGGGPPTKRHKPEPEPGTGTEAGTVGLGQAPAAEEAGSAAEQGADGAASGSSEGRQMPTSKGGRPPREAKAAPARDKGQRGIASFFSKPAPGG